MLTFTKDSKMDDVNDSDVNEFADWLQNQLDKRGWTAQDLAKQSGLGNSTVTRILTGVRGAGAEACAKIAQALGEDPGKVFRLAGLLPEGGRESLGERDFEEEMFLEWYRQLSEIQKEFILETVKGLVTRRAARRQ